MDFDMDLRHTAQMDGGPVVTFLSLTMKTTILRMTTVWILTWTCDTPLKWMVDR